MLSNNIKSGKKGKAKTRRPEILTVIFISAVIASLILVHVGFKLEIEKLTKEKVLLDESLTAKKDQNITLKVEIQKLQGEERIISIAETKLGMMKNTEPMSAISIDKKQIENIQSIVESKYE